MKRFLTILFFIYTNVPLQAEPEQQSDIFRTVHFKSGGQIKLGSHASEFPSGFTTTGNNIYTKQFGASHDELDAVEILVNPDKEAQLIQFNYKPHVRFEEYAQSYSSSYGAFKEVMINGVSSAYWQDTKTVFSLRRSADKNVTAILADISGEKTLFPNRVFRFVNLNERTIELAKSFDFSVFQNAQFENNIVRVPLVEHPVLIGLDVMNRNGKVQSIQFNYKSPSYLQRYAEVMSLILGQPSVQKDGLVWQSANTKLVIGQASECNCVQLTDLLM